MSQTSCDHEWPQILMYWKRKASQIIVSVKIDSEYMDLYTSFGSLLLSQNYGQVTRKNFLVNVLKQELVYMEIQRQELGLGIPMEDCHYI